MNARRWAADTAPSWARTHFIWSIASNGCQGSSASWLGRMSSSVTATEGSSQTGASSEARTAAASEPESSDIDLFMDRTGRPLHARNLLVEHLMKKPHQPDLKRLSLIPVGELCPGPQDHLIQQIGHGHLLASDPPLKLGHEQLVMCVVPQPGHQGVQQREERSPCPA